MTSSGGYFFDTDENGFGQCLVLTGPWRNELSSLMLSQGVTVLRLSSSAGWTDLDISFVTELRFLAGLEVFNWKLKDVTPIFQNTGLRYVGLQCEFTSKAEFQALKDLEVCKIVWRSQITGLERCTKLRHLNVVDYPKTDLIELKSLVSMERLQISSKKLLSLRGIESMARLEVFDAARCQKLNDISELKECVALRSIEFDDCKRIFAIPDDFCLDSLQEISFNNCGKIESLSPLAKCNNLRKLRFVGDTSVVDGNLDFLLLHPEIRDVWFANRAHYTLTREQLMARLQAKWSN